MAQLDFLNTFLTVLYAVFPPCSLTIPRDAVILRVSLWTLLSAVAMLHTKTDSSPTDWMRAGMRIPDQVTEGLTTEKEHLGRCVAGARAGHHSCHCPWSSYTREHPEFKGTKPGTAQVSIGLLIIEVRKTVTFLQHAPVPSLHLINNVLLYPHNKFLW